MLKVPPPSLTHPPPPPSPPRPLTSPPGAGKYALRHRGRVTTGLICATYVGIANGSFMVPFKKVRPSTFLWKGAQKHVYQIVLTI